MSKDIDGSRYHGPATDLDALREARAELDRAISLVSRGRVPLTAAGFVMSAYITLRAALDLDLGQDRPYIQGGMEMLADRLDQDYTGHPHVPSEQPDYTGGNR